MRRLPALLALTVALTLVGLALIGVASAAPPDFCDPDSPDYRPNHPRCTTTTTTSPTTTTTEPSVGETCKTVKTLGGTGNFGFECDWTPRENGLRTGTVTVTVLNMVGQRVWSRHMDRPPTGIVRVDWDGNTRWGHPAGRGSYVVAVQADDIRLTQKVVRL